MDIEKLYNQLTTKHFVFAGPCVLETEEITLKTAYGVAEAAERSGLVAVFKSSWDKANRTSNTSYRGPKFDQALEWLIKVKKETSLPIVTDIHLPEQALIVAEIAEVIQIPAFLCRQTDLLQHAAKTGHIINIKKGQFLAPWDMKAACEKIFSIGNNKLLLTERGTTFGYNNLVVDFRSIPIMQEFNIPIIFDATHSVQLPGGKGDASGGERKYIEKLSYAAAAIGANGIFLECHPEPNNALCDGPNSLYLKDLLPLLQKLSTIWELAL